MASPRRLSNESSNLRRFIGDDLPSRKLDLEFWRTEPQFPGSVRQLSWQTSNMPYVSLNTRGSRTTRSLHPWRFNCNDFIAEPRQEADVASNYTKREEHFDRLIESCRPTVQPFICADPTEPEVPERPKSKITKFDWVNHFRVTNQFDYLQPAVIDDPLILREAVEGVKTNRIVKPELLSLSTPELLTDEVQSTRTGIMFRMFCTSRSDGAQLIGEEEGKEEERKEGDGNTHDAKNSDGKDSNNEIVDSIDRLSILFHQLNDIPLAAESSDLDPLIVETASMESQSPRSKLMIIQKKKRANALSSMPMRRSPNVQQSTEERTPEIMVAVSDKVGPRLQLLQFGPQQSKRRKPGPPTITIGIQVDEKTFEIVEEKVKSTPQKEDINVPMKPATKSIRRNSGSCFASEETVRKRIESIRSGTSEEKKKEEEKEEKKEKEEVWQRVKRYEPHLVLPQLGKQYETKAVEKRRKEREKREEEEKREEKRVEEEEEEREEESEEEKREEESGDEEECFISTAEVMKIQRNVSSLRRRNSLRGGRRISGRINKLLSNETEDYSDHIRHNFISSRNLISPSCMRGRRQFIN